MKTIKSILFAVLAAVGLTSCVGDLNVTPIDPSVQTAGDALTTVDDYYSLLAQCYAGFANSGSYGPNGANNISGVDGGFSQYFRGLYHLNGLTTDEAVCGWNDDTIRDLHGLAWTPTDVFVAAFYYRIFYQVSAFNEFLRQIKNATIEIPEAARWIAEVRTLRAFCLYHAIDNYGNVPFADETAPVGMYVPERYTRAQLFSYIESELTDIIEGNDIYEAGQSPYGRINKGAAIMILAKLYLNAEVYIGEDKYQECVNTLNKLGITYSLHDSYAELFMGDNHLCTDEIIWAVEQDGVNVQSYGATNYLIFASTGGDMDINKAGIASGWGGLRTTPQFYDKFDAADVRRMFYTEKEQKEIWDKQYQAYVKETTEKNENLEAGKEAEEIKTFEDWSKAKKVQTKEIKDLGEFTNGYAFMKFTNVCSDGTIPNKSGESNPGFVNTDYPVFRYADALLMLAECELRGAQCDGLAALNKVRDRAGLGDIALLTADAILDERARELYQEGWRRSDLVRFGKFTSDTYLWAWKGHEKDGTGVAEHLNLFPIPANELNSNVNLRQNFGY